MGTHLALLSSNHDQIRYGSSSSLQLYLMDLCFLKRDTKEKSPHVCACDYGPNCEYGLSSLNCRLSIDFSHHLLTFFPKKKKTEPFKTGSFHVIIHVKQTPNSSKASPLYKSDKILTLSANIPKKI